MCCLASSKACFLTLGKECKAFGDLGFFPRSTCQEMPSLAPVGSSLSSHCPYLLPTGEAQETPHIMEHQRLKRQGAESLPLSWEKCASSWPPVFTWLRDSTKKYLKNKSKPTTAMAAHGRARNARSSVKGKM